VGQAFNAMRTGRPGPTLVTLPMDVQADAVGLPEAPEPRLRRPHDRPAGDPAVAQAPFWGEGAPGSHKRRDFPYPGRAE
jgi:thiamine pyrophosphate-dependent acetolactate synthase large subunit-like protein